MSLFSPTGTLARGTYRFIRAAVRLFYPRILTETAELRMFTFLKNVYLLVFYSLAGPVFIAARAFLYLWRGGFSLQ